MPIGNNLFLLILRLRSFHPRYNTIIYIIGIKKILKLLQDFFNYLNLGINELHWKAFLIYPQFHQQFSYTTFHRNQAASYLGSDDQD